MSKIQVHVVKPRDGGLRIGVRAGIDAAKYVTEIIERESGVQVQVDELETEQDLDGSLYLVVLGASAQKAIELLRADPEIECLPDQQ